MVGHLAFFPPAKRIFLLPHGDQSAHHLRYVLEVVPPIGNDVKSHAQIRGLAERAIRQAIPPSEKAGLRVLPNLVLVREQCLLHSRSKRIDLAHVSNDESLERS